MNLLRVRASITVDASADDVFAYLADFQLHGQWDGCDDLQVLETSSGPIGIDFTCKRLGSREERYSSGTRYTRTVHHQMIRTQRMIEYIPNRCLTYEDTSTENLELDHCISFDLTAVDGGTIITRYSEPRVSWWMAPILPVFYAAWPLIQPLRLLNQRRYLRRIKDRLELEAGDSFPYLAQR